MTSVEYGPIRDDSDAVDIQRLALQDLLLGGFKHPRRTANPKSRKRVENTVSNLHVMPENYFGAYIQDKLQGYMRIGDFKFGDEMPFLNVEEIQEYTERKERGESNPVQKLGIFGLVASDTISPAHQLEMRHTFLDFAAERAVLLHKDAIAVPIHENDPLRQIAFEHGYEATGRIGRAALLPSVSLLAGRRYLKPEQELYEKLLDY